MGPKLPTPPRRSTTPGGTARKYPSKGSRNSPSCAVERRGPRQRRTRHPLGPDEETLGKKGPFGGGRSNETQEDRERSWDYEITMSVKGATSAAMLRPAPTVANHFELGVLLSKRVTRFATSERAAASPQLGAQPSEASSTKAAASARRSERRAEKSSAAISRSNAIDDGASLAYGIQPSRFLMPTIGNRTRPWCSWA